ncbi:hypothetical protein DYB32_008088 [Aphanomyces invadans]|uniref:Uncharacterized protein n=1 Tax=Aphanomyces invadans TaxID=157072 RepID=A0A418AM98_9STRA|nr:hypothetical protein DYB32_008088 [Aphanomyces invadans]
MHAQGRSPAVGGYETLAQRKKQDRIWSELQRVLSSVEQNHDVEDASARMAAVADAYTVALQAMSRANMPYESMEAMLRHMQGQQIPVSIQIYIAMLVQAKGSAIVQVLRTVKASRAAASLLGGSTPQSPLLPTDVESLHYHAYDALIRTIHSRYMESTTAVFALANYQDLYAAVVAALPPLDVKLLERTIFPERLDKLAVASVRAPAMCGLGDVVLDRLDELQEEYAGRSAQVPLQAFEAAIEAFPALVHGLTHVPEATLASLRETSSVKSSPRIKALRRLERSVGIPMNKIVRKVQLTESTKVAQDAATFDMYKASVFLRYASTDRIDGDSHRLSCRYISNRIDGASAKETRAVVAHDAMVAADGLIQDIEDMYVASRPAADLLPLHVAQLKQYFVAASRLDRRMPGNTAFQDELVFRIFRGLDTLCSRKDDADLVLEGLRYAFRALVVLFRVSEATMVLDMKESLFPGAPPRVDDYNDLIMVVWLSPTPLTIHRLVLFQLHQLPDGKRAATAPKKKLVANLKYKHMRRRLPDWDLDIPAPEFHPLQFYRAKNQDASSVGDIVSFMIDWHNMTGVAPFGKTLKLVLEYCVRHQQDATNVHEMHRLLQWAHSLPLDPATQVYLEHLSASVAADDTPHDAK